MKPFTFTLRHLSLLAAFLAFTWVTWAEENDTKTDATPDAAAPADQVAAPAPEPKNSPDLAEAPEQPATPTPAATTDAAPDPKVDQPAATVTPAPSSTDTTTIKSNADTKSDNKLTPKDEKPGKKKKKHSIQVGPGTYHSRNDAPPLGNHSVLAGERFDDIVSIFGNTLVDGDVSSDAVAVFGNNEVNGAVGGDAVAVFGNLTINGEVNGDAVAVFGNLTLGPKAKVNGECVDVFGHVSRDPKAQVGNIQEVISFGNMPSFGGVGTWVQTCLLHGRLLWFAPGLTWAWVLVAAHLFFYFVLALIFKGATEKCVNTINERPGMTILTAFLGFLLPPLVIVLLAITGIGIILIPFFVLFLFAASYFGRTVMLAWIGRPITRILGPGPFAHIAFAVLIGGAIVALLYCVPIIAFLVHGLIGTIGFGAAILALFSSIGREKKSTQPPMTPAPVAPAPVPAAPLTPVAPLTPLTPVAPISSPASEATQAQTPLGQPPVSSAGFVAEPVAVPPAVQPVIPAAPSYQSFAATPAPSVRAPIIASSLPRASFWLRMGALLIDFLLVSLMVTGTNTILPHSFEIHFGPGIFFFMALYGALMWKLRGTTIGGIICRLQIVRTDDRPLDWGTCIVRGLGCVLSAFPFGLGFLWIAVDPNRESWHDKIAGTAVVQTPSSKPLI